MTMTTMMTMTTETAQRAGKTKKTGYVPVFFMIFFYFEKIQNKG